MLLFLSDSLKKALAPHSSSRQLTEAAAVTAVKLCKVSTYIHFLDSGNVVFALVQSVLNDLKVSAFINLKFATSLTSLLGQVLLFNPGKPFSRGQAYMNQDIDLMIDCFVSCFRINPHNNEALKVCLNPHSPPTFHYVLVASLYR